MNHKSICSSALAAAAFAFGSLAVATPALAVTHKPVHADAKGSCGGKEGCGAKKEDKHHDDHKDADKKAPSESEHHCSHKGE